MKRWPPRFWSAAASPFRRPAAVLRCGWLLALLLPAFGGEAATLFNVGISRRAFSRVNENDAIAAYRVFSDEIGKRIGYEMQTVVKVFERDEDFAAAIRRGEVVLILAGTWDYFSMAVEDAAEITFVPVSGGRSLHRWLLLVRRDSGIRDIAALKGRRVLVLNHNVATLGRPWLTSLVLEQRLGISETFFFSVDAVPKASAAILPVFFSKAEACVVDDAAFQTMADLNPQLGAQLVAIATSPAMLSGMICLNRSGWVSAKAREDARRALSEMDRDAAGRQLLTLFRAERLAPFEPAQLATVRDLYTRSQVLRATLPP